MSEQTQYVVMFSGGVGSWAAARRLVEREGADAVTLLFADTLMEDPDLYRFLDQAAADVGAPLVRIADGRDIWQVFKDRRMLGNSRIAPCSTELKQKPARRWMDENAPDGVVVLGIDWTEEHRLPGATKGWEPYRVEAPLCHPPYRTKKQLLGELAERGIELPRLYRLGFKHNNCGGGCVRAGQAQFALLRQQLPDVFARWQRGEEELQDHLGKDVSILKRVVRGNAAPLTLARLAAELDAQSSMFDRDDWGGCGCFVSAEEAP